MLALKLAYRNLIGAGLRTWLSVSVLSMSYVVIIWQQGFLDGWDRQARRDTIAQEIGGGQYWHDQYDPLDPLTFEDSHGPVPSEMHEAATPSVVAPILLTQATIYPEGRMQNVVLKGIPPDQRVLDMPTAALSTDDAQIPVLIGRRMAKNAKLAVGDVVTIRWRDVNGTFDARDARIMKIMKTDVPATDKGIFWVSLDRLQAMLQMPGEATLLVVDKGRTETPALQGWVFHDQAYLLKDITDMIRMKSASGSIMYVILLSLALLAIFDTQILSIFRRRREIGTLIALGMTRGGVIRLFTIEGALHGVLAAAVAALYGIPFLSMQAVRGFAMPKAVDSYGIAIAEKIFPVYSVQLVLGTTLIVMVSVTIVSFMPARRIAHMNPTDAISGKLS
jgi:putative ABC transport system permease protein